MSDKWVEKRQFQRILYQTPAILIDRHGHRLSCEVIDLSLRGCLLRLPRCIESEESPCTLQVSLATSTLIEMQIFPVYHRGHKQGFKCLQIDLSSLSLLKRMIELNSGDSQLLERELSALISGP